MDRTNAFTLHVIDWNNSDFWQVLAEHSKEDVLFDIQPNFKTDGIFWFEEVPLELFKYSNCFDWIHGSAKLWVNDEPLTRFNYRTPIYNDEEFNHYEYVNYDQITDIPPISDTEDLK